MTKEQAIQFLKKHPAKFGHMVGFTDLSDIHNGWMRDMLLGKGDITKQASRGTYKTTCVSLTLALIIILLPNMRSMFMRKTDDDVKEVIKQVQKILSDPHTLYLVQCIYGVNLKQVTQSYREITTNLTTGVKGTSQLLGIGTKGSITGKHFDRIFTDDIVNIDDRTSRAERERTKMVYQELQNVKNRGGRIINTGTPWHKDDCFSIMPEPDKWDCYKVGMFTDKELADIKSKMLPSLFAANYELRHIATEDIIFSNPVTGADPSLIEQARFCHIDASYGGEDYTAFTIMKKSNGKYYAFGKMWHKHVDDCMDEIKGYVDGFMAGKIWCEDNGDKGYLVKELRNKGMRAAKYHETTNKFLKITTYLKAIWNDVEFIQGTDPEYIRQVEEYNEKAEHDDAPDSLACMARLLYDRRSDEERVASFML